MLTVLFSVAGRSKHAGQSVRCVRIGPEKTGLERHQPRYARLICGLACKFRFSPANSIWST
jgi:hypothetical protein